MNLWDFKRHTERTAIVTEEGKKYSYCDVEKLQRKLGRQMEARSLVGMFVNNNLGGLIGYISCLEKNNVPILLPSLKDNVNAWQIIEKYHPQYLWIEEKYYLKMSVQIEQHYQKTYSFLDYVLLERKQLVKTVLNSDLALLLPTSGSTGNPKLVRISHKNLLANTKSICKYMNLTEEDRAITSLPMSYTYGLSVINTHLHVGGSVFLTTAKVMQRRFWDVINTFHITFLAGVPYTYEVMKKLHVAQREMPCLRMMTQAGGKLSVELQQFWGEYAQKTGKKFLVMYGQTEATARISFLPNKDCLRKLGSAGISIPDSEIMIQDKEGRKLETPNQEGEVVCYGPQVSMGYAESLKDLAKGDENKGALYTGDYGYFDEEGYLFLTGRSNRFAKLLGKRMNLSELEKKAANYLGESVVALSDDRTIFLYTDADVSESVVQKLITDMGVSVNVFEVYPKESVPRTNSGKIDYRGAI